MTLLNQIITLFMLNLCLLFAGQYYAGLMQQQREYYHLQLGELMLWQGGAAHTMPANVYNRWQAQIKEKLPEASGSINNKTITINYKSSLQDELITLRETF